MESENSGQSRKEKLKIVYNLGNRKQMTLFGTRQATQDLEMEDAQNDEVKEEENIRRTTRRSNSNPPTLSEDYGEEKLLNLFNNMNLEEEEKKVTQEQINAKKSTKKKQKKYERLKMLHFMGLSNTEIANDLQVNLSLSTIKRLRDQIRYNGDIERVIGSGRKRKLNFWARKICSWLSIGKPFIIDCKTLWKNTQKIWDRNISWYNSQNFNKIWFYLEKSNHYFQKHWNWSTK